MRSATVSASLCAPNFRSDRMAVIDPVLFPFCTATGRNAQAKSLFNAHAGVRSFMVFSPDKIGVYLDWRTQEVGLLLLLPAMKPSWPPIVLAMFTIPLPSPAG